MKNKIFKVIYNIYIIDETYDKYVPQSY